MDVVFANPELDRLETDPEFNAGLSKEIVKAFRRRMQQVRAARDSRDLYASRGARAEKLKGSMKGLTSLRLNNQFRLIIRITNSGSGEVVEIRDVTDYHRG